ncbi:MAG: 50S ribosomal protein L16 [Candidatus Moranbacteria bacterium]|nr:50S ribosomal protein L16 [Candidatus Moranbacteria bacterium]
MLMPKKVKYRKKMRGGKIRGMATRGATVSFGDFGLKAVTVGMINSREIEAARRAMTRYVQRGGKIWIRIFPDHPMTRKGAEVPMGKGKGDLAFYIAKIRPGRILFEMAGIDEKIARRAMRLASDKLSVKTKFVTKN